MSDFLTFSKAKKAAAELMLNPEYCVDLALVYKTVFDAQCGHDITFDDRLNPNKIEGYAGTIEYDVAIQLDNLNIEKDKIGTQVNYDTRKKIAETAADIVRNRYNGTKCRNDPKKIGELIAQNAVVAVAKQYGLC